jgi:hypothetical protein
MAHAVNEPYALHKQEFFGSFLQKRTAFLPVPSPLPCPARGMTNALYQRSSTARTVFSTIEAASLGDAAEHQK